MRGFFIAAGFAGVLASAGSANANEVIGSQPVFAFGQEIIVCTIANLAGAPVNIVSKRIFRNDGTAKALTIDTCDSSLAAPKSCSIQADVDGINYHYCRFTTSNSAARVRGTIFIQSLSDGILATGEIR